MGFNFEVAHPVDVLGDHHGTEIAKALRERFGPAVPLGEPGADAFCLADELGWSWWQEMQARAELELGADQTAQIRSADAWQAVYLDIDVERELIPFPGGRDPNAAWQSSEPEAETWFGRILRRLGVRRSPTNPEVERVMAAMVASLATRKGERGHLQVGNLRRLLAELTALLRHVGVEPTRDAVEALMLSYTEDDERVDSDPDLQCLCHAWITATEALARRAPMWLVK